jgi:pyrroloquinoline-quinone synthase
MTCHFHAQDFWTAVEACIAKFDLLTHPFYEAWSCGQLTRDDLREYATAYYPHVAAFPTYLSAFHSRLGDGELRRTVLRNLAEEEIQGRPHSELWRDFAEGMGADREGVSDHASLEEIQELVSTFRDVAVNRGPAECLAAFYAYESQVPRIAETKWSGLEKHYGADAKTGGYFRLHRTADVRHAEAWRKSLTSVLAEDPGQAGAALATTERVGAALWRALDGIERQRRSRNSHVVE